MKPFQRCVCAYTHTHMLTALTAQGGHTHTQHSLLKVDTHTHTALTAQGGHTHSTHCSTSVVVLCPFLVPQSDLQATFGLLRDRFLLKRKVHPAHCTPHLSPTSPHLPPRHPHRHLTSPPSTPHTSSHSPNCLVLCSAPTMWVSSHDRGFMRPDATSSPPGELDTHTSMVEQVTHCFSSSITSLYKDSRAGVLSAVCAFAR